MKCSLGKKISHKNIRKRFKETYVECPLLSREDIGMNPLGIVCCGCCIRIQQLTEAKTDLILRQIISLDDYKRHPDIIQEYLPEHLNEYYVALKNLGKTLDDAIFECSRCNPVPIGDESMFFDKAVEMTACVKDDWK